ncbi:MAG: hypothetical protein IKT10_01725 [Clostridiales bacterium]|nr:hypothetical protein [Clostridiales bacterium]
MNEKYVVQGVACFIAVPFFAWIMFSIYDYLAHETGNPANFYVNATAIIGFAGVLFLVIYGIVNLVKAKKLKNTKNSKKK